MELTHSWEIFGNRLYLWGLALLAFVLVFGVTTRLRSFIDNRLVADGRARRNLLVRVLLALTSRTYRFFLAAVALWIAVQFLVLPPRADRLISGIVLAATMIQLGLWGSAFVSLWIENHLLGPSQPDPARSSAAQIVRIMGLSVVWSAVVLVMLSNLGIDITGLVAGLGIGGIAIAFALQSLLKDLFASLAIILDKPFIVGDFITFDGSMGTVEKVGLKTTRIRALSGEQLCVANDTLLNARLHNFKRMQERRVVFDLHTHSRAPIAKLQELATHIRKVIEAIDKTRFDRSHLAEFAQTGPRIETVYYVLSADYNVYMDIHQKILVQVAQWSEDNNLELASPAQRVLVDRDTVEQLLEAFAAARSKQDKPLIH
ncbi:mechanosensitive ion channel family protein [Phyllobacterium salinisoli]|uniref:Mechanosensitive ion channel family protein n=1 Tax=Phyllobacterium salinisoli TaxID=1899321 RepID=A0A368K9D2_9HYPH|nr:mechanosensitive ion channel family protein [Phyllobacterium salinisoli]